MPEDENKVLTQLEKDFPAEEDRESTDDIFGKGTEATTEETEDDEIPQDLKNRHIRRLEAKLAKEREANIELAAREAARSEYEKFRKDTKELTVDESLITLYGDTDNGRRAAQITQALLEKTAQKAKEEALTEFKKNQEDAAKEVDRYHNLVEQGLEEIEDTYNVDLSGTTEASKATRTAFLTLVGKLSPKNANGDIESYVDFDSAWELFQDRQQRSNNRNKELASRGTVRSASTTETKVQPTVHERWLRDQGII